MALLQILHICFVDVIKCDNFLQAVQRFEGSQTLRVPLTCVSPLTHRIAVLCSPVITIVSYGASKLAFHNYR